MLLLFAESLPTVVAENQGDWYTPVAAVVRTLLWICFIAWALNARIGAGGGVPERLAWDRASGTAVVRVPRAAVAAQSIVRT